MFLAMTSLLLAFSSVFIAATTDTDFISNSEFGSNFTQAKIENLAQDTKKCRYPGMCATPSGAEENCRVCRNGFAKDPEDDTRCKYANLNASLIISSRDDIRILPLDGLTRAQTIQKNDFVTAFDYNFQTNTIFWSSYSDQKVYQGPINEESGSTTSIRLDTTSEIYGLAVDWIHNHLYWLDLEKEQLCVSNFNGTMKKVLFTEQLQWSQSIAVNPLNGWMHWTDFDKHRIERAGMDGSQREVILSTNIKVPRGLVVDVVDNRLYWTQGYNPCSIWSSNFDGSDPKSIFTATGPEFGGSDFWKIASFNEHVYWIEFYSKTIYRVNKCDEEALTKVQEFEPYVWDIKIYHEAMQPKGENLCSKRISKCSHFCFPVPVPGTVPSRGSSSVSTSTTTTTTCACPDGLLLSEDQRSCV